uniref:hypothetical protein n=1 Tax=Staphylococcus aureus TaxID=1280 RepID=UPI0038B3543F
CHRIDPCHHGLPPQTAALSEPYAPSTTIAKQRATAQRIKQEHPANNLSHPLYFSCIELYSRNKPRAIYVSSKILSFALFLDGVPQQ